MKFFRRFFGKPALEALFTKRTKRYTEDTAQIILRMPNAMKAIGDFLANKNASMANATLVWSEISLQTKNVVRPFVLFAGIAQYAVGAKAELQNGDQVTVSPNTKEYFQSLIQFGIPLDLVEGSYENVMAYLKEKDIEREKDVEETVKRINEAFGADNKELTAPEYEYDDGEDDETFVAQNDTVGDEDDFDLTQLTEEQRRQLDLSIKMGKG